MRDRHLALLVEDEPEMAEELADFLESLGHDHVHAATQEEALALVDQHHLCYALVDLQIKVNEGSIKPRVEAGQTLVERLRARFPRRNEQDHHSLQLLVMSGHAKEHHYVVRAFQTGANDFITKPLSDNQPPVAEKIRAALERSARGDHSSCGSLRADLRSPELAGQAAPRLEPGQEAVLDFLRSRSPAFETEHAIQQKTHARNVRAVISSLRALGYPVESAREARRHDRGVPPNAKGYRLRKAPNS